MPPIFLTETIIIQSKSNHLTPRCACEVRGNNYCPQHGMMTSYIVACDQVCICAYPIIVNSCMPQLQTCQVTLFSGRSRGQVWPWLYHIYGELELGNMQKWVWLLSLPSMAVPLPNCLLQSWGVRIAPPPLNSCSYCRLALTLIILSFKHTNHKATEHM